ncbi:MAG: hypothetical protein QXT61_05390 [Candidatus Caldarchaeum sp.]
MFAEKAETLHYSLREKAVELGLPTRGGQANAVVFSPPYCNMISAKDPTLRGFSKDDMRTFTGGNYRAFVHQLVASAYIMLRRFGWCVVVVKQAVSTKTGQTTPELVANVMRAVGFKNVEKHVFQLAKPSAFYEYHKARGHEHEHLAFEYVVAGQKGGKQPTEVVENV